MDIITRKEAKKQNFSYYFTGQPCKRGHISPRNTNSSNCHQCWNEDAAKKRKSDPELFKQLKRNEYLRNRTSILEQQKVYRQNNWLSILERRQNSVAHKQYMLRYLSNYVKNNHIQKAKQLARTRKRQLLIRRAMPKWAEVEAISQLYQQSARLTKATGIKYEVDHIIPLKGVNVCGLHCLSNLRIITKQDNRAKSNMLDESLIY